MHRNFDKQRPQLSIPHKGRSAVEPATYGLAGQGRLGMWRIYAVGVMNKKVWDRRDVVMSTVYLCLQSEHNSCSIFVLVEWTLVVRSWLVYIAVAKFYPKLIELLLYTLKKRCQMLLFLSFSSQYFKWPQSRHLQRNWRPLLSNTDTGNSKRTRKVNLNAFIFYCSHVLCWFTYSWTHGYVFTFVLLKQ